MAAAGRTAPWVQAEKRRTHTSAKIQLVSEEFWSLRTIFSPTSNELSELTSLRGLFFSDWYQGLDAPAAAWVSALRTAHRPRMRHGPCQTKSQHASCFRHRPAAPPNVVASRGARGVGVASVGRVGHARRQRAATGVEACRTRAVLGGEPCLGLLQHPCLVGLVLRLLRPLDLGAAPRHILER